LKKAKELIQSTVLTQGGGQDGGEGYSFEVVEVEYGGVKQRWLIVLSEKAREREINRHSASGLQPSHCQPIL